MITMNTLQTARFGAIEYAVDDVVTIPEGLLGFPDRTQFLVLSHKEGSPFRWLQCIDEPGLAFLIVDPGHFVAGYAPVLSDEAASSLELVEETPRLVYTIATIPNGKPDEMTINLAGPIVINGVTRVARQLVIEDPNCAIKHRVFNQTAERVAA